MSPCAQDLGFPGMKNLRKKELANLEKELSACEQKERCLALYEKMRRYCLFCFGARLHSPEMLPKFGLGGLLRMAEIYFLTL